ncbi:MAG: HAMP domain-containing histidine kinase [Clostridia bacterium]|nr:HAMP domain-containing histidine kinase [Clostridia bacterium]
MKKSKNKNKRKLWTYFLSCVFVGFGITVPLELILAALVKYFFNVQISMPNLLWITFVSIVAGAVVMSFASKIVITPLTKLSSAMKNVAEGDFETQIETESRLEGIQDIYTNFNLMVGELNATETLQTDFVSNVSHEIKTPITAIEGYATLLQDCDDPESEAEYIEKILSNTKRLSELVGNVLLLSKVDNKAIQAKKTTYRLDEQIRQAILMLEPRWSAKNIEFDVDMDDIEYTGDKGLIFHVWNNLIDNAVKFSPDGGLVKISLKKIRGKTVFTIEDDGQGINDEEKTRIFNKFYQSDSSHKAEGNGLGLSLTKNILALCGGEITVENASDGGALFTVVL